MKIPITQSKEWQKFQDTLGETSFLEQRSDFQYLAILKKTPVGNYLYLPYGPVAKDKQSFKAALKSLDTLAKNHQAIFTRIEPQNPDFAKSLPKTVRKSKDLNPSYTLIVDIDRSREEILRDVSHSNKNRFNTFAKKGLKIEISHDPADVKYLVEFQKALAKDKGIGVFSEDYLKKQLSQPFACLYLVKYNPTFADEQPDPKETKVIAAILIFDDDTTRYYIQSAQDKTYKKLAATSVAVCQTLIDAHEQGLKYFDFWGIAPEDAPDDHPWKGFTEFKQSFGGQPVAYLGTYDIVHNSFKYHLYQLFRKVNRILRKLN